MSEETNPTMPEDETPPTDADEQAAPPQPPTDLGNETSEWLRAPTVVADEDAASQSPFLSYPVVGIGASAGGLQAFRQLLELLPTETGMAFVLITHLHPEQTSYLKEIARTFTKIPVHPISQGVRPQPDCLYILQPGEVARLTGGIFQVTPRPDDRVFHPVDAFFHSLAIDQRNYAVGVVLSGADSDGAVGMKAIKGEGGMALVQSPETAEQSGMPRSSIAADHVDLIVSPRELGVELGRLAKHFKRAEIRSLEAGEELPDDHQSFIRILNMLRAFSGLELRQYKPDTIRRRIARRMVLLRMESLPDYVRFLSARKDELANLQEDVLINVTRFFRDPGMWAALNDHILPTFFKNRTPERPVRIWCAGCSSGEEAYSLAIVLLEYTTLHSIDAGIQIFGTDASERSIETARAAVYPDALSTEISPERLRRFFVKVDRGYQVSKRVRDLCVFARQNLCSDPPFSRIDMLSCRNVLIYFNQALQRQILSTFHYALDPAGYLILGTSESLREYEEAFGPADRKYKIYSRLPGNLSSGFRMPMHRVNLFGDGLPVDANDSADRGWSDLELQRAADRIILARFGPPGLIVDEQLMVLQVRGQTSPYVELASGAVSWSLPRVISEILATPVLEAVERSLRDNVPVSRVADVLRDEGSKPVRIDVLPVTQHGSHKRCLLVLFADVQANPALSTEAALTQNLTVDEKDRMIAQIRQDLASTRFHLQSLIEERDARNQELVSANEEIQSANEELQSTNEELETTKEELQSANEELQTVNDELQQRNLVLTQTGNDLTNLLTSVNIPLLMLTDTLHIRQFTPPMGQLMNLRSSDIGRPLREIRLQLSIDNIEPILQQVLDTLGTRELEVQDRDGKWHLLRVRPYRTADNKIEGLVVVMVDIDQLRRSRKGMEEARDFAASVVESVPISVVVIEQDFNIKTVNTAFCQLTGMPERELIGRSAPDLVALLWGVDGFRKKLDALSNAQPGHLMEFEHESTSAQAMTLLIKGQTLPTDGTYVIMLTMEDITMRRRAEFLIAREKEALESEVERTGKTLLQAQEELRYLAAHLFALQEEERRYVARELHDDIAQRLSALRLQWEATFKNANGNVYAERLAAILASTDSLNADVRNLSHRLHPAILEDLGLTAALRALVEEFRERENMPADYISKGDATGLSLDRATAVYRIGQEALRNVAKHAGPTHVKIFFDGNEAGVRLEVRDFGVGFDQEDERGKGGLGLISMKERSHIAGGKLTVTSSLGEGTSVVFNLPVAKANA